MESRCPRFSKDSRSFRTRPSLPPCARSFSALAPVADVPAPRSAHCRPHPTNSESSETPPPRHPPVLPPDRPNRAHTPGTSRSNSSSHPLAPTRLPKRLSKSQSRARDPHRPKRSPHKWSASSCTWQLCLPDFGSSVRRLPPRLFPYRPPAQAPAPQRTPHRASWNAVARPLRAFLPRLHFQTMPRAMLRRLRILQPVLGCWQVVPLQYIGATALAPWTIAPDKPLCPLRSTGASSGLPDDRWPRPRFSAEPHCRFPEMPPCTWTRASRLNPVSWQAPLRTPLSPP